MAKVTKVGLFALTSFAALSLGLLLLLALQQSASAGGVCADTYTVRRGDTLIRIAQRSGVSYAELIAANQGNITNPNMIYVGQVLCLPPVAATAGPQAVADSKVVLEAAFRYITSIDEDKLELPRSGELGKRSELRLQAVDPVTVFTETREITQALVGGPSPVLVGMRNRDQDGELTLEYTLVAIGAGDLLGQLAVSGTLPITLSTGPGQSKPLLAFFAQPDLETLEEAGLWFLMEAGDGARMPFYVSNLDVVSDYLKFKEYYLDKRLGDAPARVRADDIGFALFLVGQGRYHLMLRLSRDGYGPSHWTTKERCSSWRSRRGRWFSFFKPFYGCSGG